MLFNRSIAKFGIRHIIGKRIIWLLFVGSLLGWLLGSGILSKAIGAYIFIALPFLVGIFVGDVCHFFNHFHFHFSRRGDRLQALHYSFSQYSKPGLLAAVAASIIGFGICLTTESHAMWNIAVICGGGVLLLFTLGFLLLPIVFSFGPALKKRRLKKQPSPMRMVRLSKWILNKRLILLPLSLVVYSLTTFQFIRIALSIDSSVQIIDLFTRFIIGIVIVGLLSGFYLRSFRAGMLMLWFNLFPLMLLTISLGSQPDLSGNTVTMIMLIIGGLTANTSVRLFLHFQEEFEGFREYEKALQQTFMKTGVASFCSIGAILPISGSLLFLNRINIPDIAMPMIVGVLALTMNSFFFLPVILIRIRPLGIKVLTPPDSRS